MTRFSLAFCSGTLGLLTLASAPAMAACYTVFAPAGTVVYQADTPPVDMAYQLHQTVPARFGAGALLRFTLADDACPPVGVADGSTGPTTGYRAEMANRETVNADAITGPRMRHAAARRRAG